MKEETGKLISEAISEGLWMGLKEIWWIIVLFIVAGITIRIFEKWVNRKIDNWKRRR